MMKLKMTILASIALAQADAQGAVTISQTRAVASVNAFAPLDKSMYFDEHILENTSPSLVHAEGDWTGTNLGGTIPTWHWVCSADVNVSTSFTPTNLSIAGAGTFGHDITTTSEFVDPSYGAQLFAPGSVADFRLTFSVDTPGSFALTGTLSRYGSFQLYSTTQATFIYNKINNSPLPLPASTSGILTPGEYVVRANTGLGGIGFSQGQNHEFQTGSFSNFLFTVQAPEPGSMAGILFGAALLRRRRGLNRR